MRRYPVQQVMVLAITATLGCDIIAGINQDYKLSDGSTSSTGGGGTVSTGGGNTTSMGGGGTMSTGGGNTTSMGGGGTMSTGGGTTTSMGGGGTTSTGGGGTTSTGGGGTTSTGGGGTTSTGGGGSGGGECSPGSVVDCYTGPPATEDVGACKGGTSTCSQEGTWGVCANEVVPVAESCSTPVDDDCDGTALDQDTGCLCLPGSMSPCYSGPVGTSGVGVCQDGLATCAADGKGYSACVGDTVPSAENCMTAADENCDGLTPPCPGGQLWAKRFGDAATQIGRAVAVDASSGVYAGGYFFGTTDFGAGNLVSAGGSDAFIARLDSAGTLLWAQKYGDAGSQETKALARDGAGGVVATGMFSGSIDFGLGPLLGAGAFDIFLARLGSNGAAMWAKSFGNNSNQLGLDVAVADNGSIAVTGYFGGAVDFGGGSLSSTGLSDAFVARFAADGAHQWSRKLGGTSNDYGYGVATQTSGATVVTGTFAGSVDFGTGTLMSAGGNDLFLVSLDAGGLTTWAKRFGDSGEQSVTGIDVAPVSGNIVIVGSFAGSVDFGGGALASSGGQDAFIAIFGPTGNHLWSVGFGGTSDDVARAVAFDAQGNFLVTGSFASAAMSVTGVPLAGAGGNDVFVAKFDAGPNLVWASAYGNASNQAAHGLAMDGSGNAILTGALEGSIDFGGGMLTSAGTEDVFLAKLAP